MYWKNEGINGFAETVELLAFVEKVENPLTATWGLSTAPIDRMLSIEYGKS